jgi:hypothetical protein
MVAADEKPFIQSNILFRVKWGTLGRLAVRDDIRAEVLPLRLTRLEPLGQLAADADLEVRSKGIGSGHRRGHQGAADRRWYLVAFDLERDDWRTFRVDRITSLKVPGHTFVPRPLSDPARMVAEGITTAHYTHTPVVLVKAPLEEVATVIAPHVGVLSEAGAATTLLELGIDDFEWLAGYLIGLGLEFEVREPVALRAYMATLGVRLSEAHGD